MTSPTGRRARLRGGVRRATASLILLLAVLAACGGPGRAQSSCSGDVLFGGERMIGIDLDDRDLPAPAGTVTASTIDCDGGGDQEVELERMEGVPPYLALRDPGDSDVLYMAEGRLPQLPEHPLHRALHGSDERLAGPRERGCRRATIAGRVEHVPILGRAFTLRRPSGGTSTVGLTVDTRFVGLRRRGYVQLRPRAAVTVRMARCPSRRNYARRISARG